MTFVMVDLPASTPPPLPLGVARAPAGPQPPGPPPVGPPREGPPPVAELPGSLVAAPVVAAPLVDSCPVPETPLADFSGVDDDAAPPPFSLRTSFESFGASAVLHAVLVLALALWQIAAQFQPIPVELSAEILSDPPTIESLRLPQLPTSPDPRKAEEEGSVLAQFDAPAVSAPTPEDNTPEGKPDKTVGLSPTMPGKLLVDVRNAGAGGLAGRGAEKRGKLVREEGGSAESETAVRLGLAWLALHQEKNGSWRFNHSLTCCVYCGNPGRNPSITGATAMGLLPFLGAGQTHQEGEFQDTVRRGLYYLMDHMVTTPHGGDLQDGTMYAHGLAAIALCEAYALTGDKALQVPAQRALDFIVHAQDKKGGGWRYEPGQPGDTSMLGWQLMALKSGQMAYLKVPADSPRLAGYFLDSVETDRGAMYGYLTPGNGRGTSAIGLLSRMYLGWKRDTPALERGVAHLDIWGPSKDDMYYNYYATQVLHHWGGRPWQKWNAKMRDYLVAKQSREGHESGSWFFAGGGPAGDTGGRLYNTSLSVMILEVYYRHMPLYRQQSVDEGF